MADIFTKKKRSTVMAAVKSSGNRSTELRLIAIMKQHHIKGWRRNYKLYGKPDFVFLKKRIAVFVDGDFWHGNPNTFYPPKTNKKFWLGKIKTNRHRDRQVTLFLKKKGWKVIRIWESSLRKKAKDQAFRLINSLRSS